MAFKQELRFARLFYFFAAFLMVSGPIYIAFASLVFAYYGEDLVTVVFGNNFVMTAIYVVGVLNISAGLLAFVVGYLAKDNLLQWVLTLLTLSAIFQYGGAGECIYRMKDDDWHDLKRRLSLRFKNPNDYGENFINMELQNNCCGLKGGNDYDETTVNLYTATLGEFFFSSKAPLFKDKGSGCHQERDLEGYLFNGCVPMKIEEFYPIFLRSIIGFGLIFGTTALVDAILLFAVLRGIEKGLTFGFKHLHLEEIVEQEAGTVGEEDIDEEEEEEEDEEDDEKGQ